MTAARSLVPLWDRRAEWRCRLAMIAEARSFLYLSTYYLEYDDYGRELLAALVAAARRGVAVHLLIDAFGQRLGGVLMPAQAKAALSVGLEALRALGAAVIFYRPPRYLQRRLGGGQHVKIQVSEAGTAIFGSSNISRSSFEGWNEYSVSLRGPVVRALLKSFRDIGGTVTDGHLEQLASIESAGDANLQLDYFLCNPNSLQGAFGPIGWADRNAVTQCLIDRIDSAERSIGITSFYFKPVETLLTALLRAAARGVTIEVFHSHRDALPASDLPWIAAAVSYERLLKAGIRIYENRHGEHSKIVAVDGAWVAFGSYNFEEAAHDRLAEAMLVSRDARAVEPVLSIFEQLRGDGDNVPVTAEALREFPARLKLRRAAYGRFKRWL